MYFFSSNSTPGPLIPSQLFIVDIFFAIPLGTTSKRVFMNNWWCIFILIFHHFGSAFLWASFNLFFKEGKERRTVRNSQLFPFCFKGNGQVREYPKLHLPFNPNFFKELPLNCLVSRASSPHRSIFIRVGHPIQFLSQQFPAQYGVV